MLGGLSALALGSFVGCDADVDQDMTGQAPGGSGSGAPAGAPGAGGVRAGATGNQPPPYTLASQSVLSEDYFLLKPGTFDPANDKVAAYVHDDAGQLEAMIIQEGVLSQLFHDADASGSWSLAPVKVGADDLVEVLDVVAGRPLGPDGSVGRLHVFCRTRSAVLHLVQQPDRSWTSTDLGWLKTGHAPVQPPLQVSESPTGGMAVYWFQQISGEVELSLCVVEQTDGAEKVASNPTLLTSVNPPPAVSESVVRLSRANGALQLYWFGGQGLMLNVTLIDLTEDLQVSASRPMCGTGTLGASLSRPRFRAAFSVSESQPPFAVADGPGGALYRLTYDPQTRDASTPWTWSSVWEAPAEGYRGLLATGIRGLAKAEGRSATDRADKVLDLYPLLESTLSIMRQTPSGDAVADSTAPLFSPLLGLQGGVQAVSVPTTRGAGAALMFLNTAGELRVLTQDATSGAWSGAPVHLPATEHLQLSTYRTQLSLTDAWAQPVRGGTLEVMADVPTPAMIGGDTVFLHPGTPVTVSTDQTGRVTVAVPADGLDTAALTVTGSLAAPVTIRPNAVVNGFLTGTETLNGMPALTADGFASAPIGPNGKTVEADRAGDAFAVISNAAKAGIPKAKRTGDQRKIHRTGRPHDRRRDTVVVRGVEWSVLGFLNEFGNAIETGAAEVSHAVVTTVVDVVTKVADWAVELTVTCGELVDQVLTIAVTDLRSAAQVVHGALAWVGAEVGSFVHWLEAKILAVLTDTVHVAAQYESWVRTAVGTFLPGEVKAGKAAIKAELTKVQGLVDSALTTLAAKFDSQSLADLGAAPATPRHGLRGATSPPPPDTGTAHGSWLMEKLQAVFDGTGITLATPTALTQLHDDLQDDSAKALADFTGAVQELWTTLSHAMSRPQDIPTYGMSHLVDSFRQLVDSVFALATLVSDLVCDAVLAALSLVSSVLDASIGDLPLIGPLLTAAGLGPDVTAVKLVTLVMAFPTVVAYKVRHGVDSVPFAALQSQGTRALPGVSGETVDADLKFAATSAMVFWAFADSISAVLSLDDDAAVRRPGGALGGSVSVWGLIDVIAPAVVTTLTIPRQPTHWPFADPVNLEDGGGTFNGGVSWLLGYFPMIAAVIPMCFDSGDPRKAAIDQESLCMTSLMSAVALFFGIRGNVDSEPAVSAAAWGATVLGALPGIGCIGLTEPVQKATGEMSVPLQAANCLIIGGLAAAAYSYAS